MARRLHPNGLHDFDFALTKQQFARPAAWIKTLKLMWSWSMTRTQMRALPGLEIETQTYIEESIRNRGKIYPQTHAHQAFNNHN